MHHRPLLIALACIFVAGGVTWALVIDRDGPIAPALGPAVQVQLTERTTGNPTSSTPRSSSPRHPSADPTATPRPDGRPTPRTSTPPNAGPPLPGAKTVPRHAPAPAGDDDADEDDDDDDDGPHDVDDD